MLHGIHHGAICPLSETLDIIGRAAIRGTPICVVTLPYISPHTFRIFAEFAYTGDYTGDLTRMPMPPIEAQDAQEEAPDQSNDHLTQGNGNEPTASIPVVQASHLNTPGVGAGFTTEFIATVSNLRQQFLQMRYGDGAREFTHAPWFIYLCELYSFATQYSIEPLRQKTVATIHLLLCKLGLNVECTRRSMLIIKYMYEHCDKSEDGKCQLRDVCLRYAACQALFISKCRALEELLQSDPKFSQDYMKLF